MKTKVAITVDVEPSIAGAFADPERNTPLIHEPVWGEVGGRSEALGFLIDTLVKHRLCATFFVETAHTSYFPADIMAGYARRLIEAGQDVQLHVHPCWLSFENGRNGADGPVSDQCGELAEDALAELIGAGRGRIAEWTGTAPECMRTGNFSASRGVFRAMRAGGIRVSSNICAAVSPPADRTLLLAGGAHRIEGIIELPVTCFIDRGPVGRGRLRPMQITACSFEEQRARLVELHRAGGGIAVIVTHPFEFLKWSGASFSRLRANRMVQRRFERLCAFLAENGDRFEIVPFARIAADGIDPEPASELTGSPVSSVRRAVENFAVDHLPF